MTTSLYSIREEARDAVALDVKHGNLDPHDTDAVDTYCHETADGHHDVIYTYATRDLFARGDLDDYLEEAWDSAVPERGDVDSVLMVAAYYAVRQAYADAVSEYLLELDPAVTR